MHSLEYKEFLLTFNSVYSEALTSLGEQVKSTGCAGNIPEIISYLQFFSQEGKRIRPYVAYYSYTTGGGKENIDNILISLELLHLFTLIHDDVIDQSSFRHSLNTPHTFSEMLYHADEDKNAQWRGVSQGVLLGDLVLSWSQKYLHLGVTLLPSEIKEKIIICYQTMLEEVIIGQMLDVDLSSTDTIDIDDVIKKNALKSGNYTFVWPLSIGAVLAYANNQQYIFVRRIGALCGAIFQAQDDILDISHSSGKPQCKDIEEGQQTMLSVFMISCTPPDIKREYLSYTRRTLDEKEKAEVVALLHVSGAIMFVETYIQNTLTELYKVLEESQFSQEWEKLIKLIENRKR